MAAQNIALGGGKIAISLSNKHVLSELPTIRTDHGSRSGEGLRR